MSEERLARIRERLQRAFAPSRLELIDDSAQHRGHAGARGGAGHYRLLIRAEALRGLSRLEQHRAVYAALAEWIPGEIHALSIDAGAD
ncbi:MAG TPA: BolA family protein [Nevskiaceae bacterium]|nr:BolA family protein [Nevskiaceae bacterium]